jgi:LysM repeat protein
VETGDSLEQLAKAFSTTIEKIRQKNPDIKDANVIHVGQVLLICPKAAGQPHDIPPGPAPS